jgi:hypothetical protein
VQKTVAGFVSDGRANPSAGWDCVLFLQGPGHQDCLDSARRIEDRAAEIPRAKIFVDQGGFELLLDKTLDPYGRWIARQERLRLQSLQTNLVYFAKIFEVQLEGVSSRRRWNFAHAIFSEEAWTI